MKRFSVLVLLIGSILYAVGLFNKSTYYKEVKETNYGTQEVEREGNRLTITDNVKFVFDTNVSEER